MGREAVTFFSRTFGALRQGALLGFLTAGLIGGAGAPGAAASEFAAQLRASPPKAALKECEACPAVVSIPAGSFVMGSSEDEVGHEKDEAPQRKVSLRGFAIGQTEVTVAEYRRFIEETGHNFGGRHARCFTYETTVWEEIKGRSWKKPGYRQTDDHPVVCVSPEDVYAYIDWLNGKVPGEPYRLPSEAEWEYAARAGTTTPFWWGASIGLDQANYHGDLVYDGGEPGPWRKRTLPVKSLEPNPFGLYQVHGNVWEWTDDCYHYNYGDAPTDGSPQREHNCARRVLRGGAWYDHPTDLRSASRVRYLLHHRVDCVGFRIARSLE